MTEEDQVVRKSRLLLTEAEESRKKFLESKAQIANRIISVLHEAGFTNVEFKPDRWSLMGMTIRIDVKLDARPGIVLENPGVLTDKARDNLKKSWEEEHGGLDKSEFPE